MKYNGTQPIITTDDIIVSGDSSNVGQNITLVLDQQGKKLDLLSSNIKWLAKYGGIGGGSSSSSSTTTKFKFAGEIHYTDLANLELIKTISSTNLNEFNLQTLKGSSVTVILRILSPIQSTTNYSASISFGTTVLGEAFNTLTGSTQISFVVDLTINNGKISVRGDSIIEIPFKCYTIITSDDIHINSGNTYLISNNGIFYTSYNTNINNLIISIENKIPGEFEVTLPTKVTFDGVDINITEDDIVTDSDNYRSVITLNISNKFNGSRSYGLIPINCVYTITNIDTQSLLQKELQCNIIYKDNNSEFIYCYTDSPNSLDLKNTAQTTPSSIINEDRNIKLYYKIYGKASAQADTTYSLKINDVVILTAAKGNTLYTYYLTNDVTVDSGTWKEIKFQVNAVTQSYYCFLKKVPEITYIFKQNGTLCYGAIGINSSISGNHFPLPASGLTYFVPDNETTYSFKLGSGNALLTDYHNSIHSYLNPSSNNNLSEVLKFITGTLTQGTITSDAIINVGINYLDLSYNDYIFSLTSYTEQNEKSNEILIYRDTIKYNNENQSISRFAIPNDNKFHLITIYIKKGYCLNEITNYNDSNLLKTYVGIFIDGILEVAPFEINPFILGNRLDLKLNKGNSKYNHFGIYYVNPKNSNLSSYNKTVLKYVLDFDYIMVSNYFITYNNKDNYTYDSENYVEFADSLQLDFSYYTIAGSTGWLNYYTPNNTPHYKFLNIPLKFIALLVDLDKIPIYKIVPEADNTSTAGLHSFVEGTFNSLSESSELITKKCQLYKATKSGSDYTWNQVFNNSYKIAEGDSEVIIPINFSVKFQGSSTLLYSVKNFSLAIDPVTINESVYELYFNPNGDLWSFPETTFNLKADLVDSSSSTNNVVANFVNDYMISPFGNGTQTCLSGFPILLYMENNVGDLPSGSNKDLFLGIYNFNLGRSAINNLGYLALPTNWNSNKLTSSIDSSSYVYIRSANLLPTIKKFYVAEIAANSGIYDFTQFNHGLLLQMYGDFYYNETSTINTSYFGKLRNLSRDFAIYCYNNIIKYNTTSGILNRFNLFEYGISSNSNNINLVNNLTNRGTLYYLDSNFNYLALTNNVLIVTSDYVDSVNVPYHTSSNGVSYVGNPLFLFYPVYDSLHNLVNNGGITYYYVDILTGLNTSEILNNYDLEESLKYYMVCMAFSMVDSVQKNLTIKCNATTNEFKWYPAFYDMDTGLGLDNAGNNSNYKAFSDYIDSSGNIILDFVPHSSESENVSGWFDTPSSYLFLYAKYDGLIKGQDYTPYNYWCALRGFSSSYSDYPGYNKLKDALTFCNEYLYQHIDNLHPLIWNLNYSYKYFSASKNNASNGDTEASRFNGTMKYRRLDWLNNRLHYLDVLFGIVNSRLVGYDSSITIGNIDLKSSSNSDIEICNSMFPNFKKGSSGNISASIKDKARTPFIIVNGNLYITKITDDSGSASINMNIGSNIDVGLLGSKNFNQVSECGQFLSYLGNDVENTMQGDYILNVVINNINIKNVTLDRNSLPSLRTIKIGSDSALNPLVPTTPGNITITNSTDDRGLINTITINNLNLGTKQITLSNLHISNLIISNLTCSNLIITNCEIDNILNLNLAISVDNLSITSSILNTTTISSSSIKILSLENSLASNKNINISCRNIQNLNINGLTCKEFSNSYISSLQYTSNALTISNINIDKLILNAYGASLLMNITSNTNSRFSSAPADFCNTTITSLTITPSSRDSAMYLSIPGFAAVTSLTLDRTNYNLKFILYNTGIAYMAIENLPKISGSQEFSILLDSNATACFYKCNHLSVNNWNVLTHINNLFKDCTNCNHLFDSYGYVNNSMTFEVITKILKAILLNTSFVKTDPVKCNYLFYGLIDSNNTKFTIAQSKALGLLLTLARKVGTLSEYKGMFFHSKLGYITKEFTTTDDTHTGLTDFDEFILTCNIESTALANITKINTTSGGAGSGLITFGTITSSDDSTYTFTELTVINLATEFSSSCKHYETNIKTRLFSASDGPEIYVNFEGHICGENTNYKHLFGLGGNTYSNFKGLESWIETNYNKLILNSSTLGANYISTDFSNNSYIADFPNLATNPSFTRGDSNLESKILEYCLDVFRFLTKLKIDGTYELRTKLVDHLILVSTNGYGNYGFTTFKFISDSNLTILLELLSNAGYTSIAKLFSNCLIVKTTSGSEFNFLKSKTIEFHPDSDSTNPPSISDVSSWYASMTSLNTCTSDELTALISSVKGTNALEDGDSITWNYGLLANFKSLYRSFSGSCVLLGTVTGNNVSITSTNKIPINLHKAFISKGYIDRLKKSIILYEKTINEADEISITQHEYKFDVYYNKDSEASTINTLTSSFSHCRLEAFTNNLNFTLGIKSNTVSAASYTFYNCTYHYNNTDGISIDVFHSSVYAPEISSIPESANPVLPLNFLNFIAPNTTLTQTFATSKVTESLSYRLKGCLPISNSNYFRSIDNSLSFVNTFENCLIYYGVITTENSLIKNLYVFPDWYIRYYRLFNVVIPFTPETTNNYINNIYLFYCTTNISSLSSYTQLPKLPSKISGSDLYFAPLLSNGNYVMKSITPTNSSLSNYLLPANNSGKYVLLIPYTLMFLLDSAPSTANDTNYTIFNSFSASLLESSLALNVGSGGSYGTTVTNNYFYLKYPNLSQNIKNVIAG